MNQRDFLNFYVSTALLISAACVHVSINSIRLDSEIKGSVPVISTEKDRALVAVIPKAFSTPAVASTPEKTGRERWEKEIVTSAMLCGVVKEIYSCLIQRESNFNPDAISIHGAVGLAQIKPSTAKGLSETLDVYEPWQNLLAGACYLRQLYDKNGKDWTEALYGYHAGPYRLETSQETKDYAQDIMSCAFPNRK